MKPVLPKTGFFDKLSHIAPPTPFHWNRENNRNPGNSFEVVRSDPRQTLPSSSNKLPQSMAVQMVPVFFPINGSVCMAYMGGYNEASMKKKLQR